VNTKAAAADEEDEEDSILQGVYQEGEKFFETKEGQRQSFFCLGFYTR
jgi:hypothetical protein